MDFDVPSLLASLVVSSVGFVIFRYGRSQRRLPHVAVGMALMLFPYAVSSATAIVGIALGLLGLLWTVARYRM
jgi:hypothetical protein